MNKTILYIAVSLDGFIAGKNDDISWLAPFEGGEYGYKKFLSGIGAIIEGKRTYDISVERGFVKAAHPVPSLILTHESVTKIPDGIDVTFVSGDAENILKQAKNKTKKDIWIVGGAKIAQMFINKGLIDEYVLTIIPIILGVGTRLFENIKNKESLELQETKTFDNGLVQLIYQRA